MTEVLKPIGAYALTVLLAHLSAHYHLTAEQSAAVAADLGTAGAAIAGVWLHWRAWLAQPPKPKGG